MINYLKKSENLRLTVNTLPQIEKFDSNQFDNRTTAKKFLVFHYQPILQIPETNRIFNNTA